MSIESLDKNQKSGQQDKNHTDGWNDITSITVEVRSGDPEV